jgi:hypothetical protein
MGDLSKLHDNLLWADGRSLVPRNAQKNYSVFLTHHPDLRGLFVSHEPTNFGRGGTVYDRYKITAPIPGSFEDNGKPFRERSLDDSDITDLVCWFEEFSGMPGSISRRKIMCGLDDAVARIEAELPPRPPKEKPLPLGEQMRLNVDRLNKAMNRGGFGPRRTTSKGRKGGGL